VPRRIAPSSTFPVSREQVLRLAVRSAVRVPGNVVEFGVAQGASTRVLRSELRRVRRRQPKIGSRRLFACDSFRGLPEQFETLASGTFACEPPRIRGVELVVGYFDDALDDALARRVGRVALASLDADLESSTMCALRWLTQLIDQGSCSFSMSSTATVAPNVAPTNGGARRPVFRRSRSPSSSVQPRALAPRTTDASCSRSRGIPEGDAKLHRRGLTRSPV
jgi:hypothetical protein